MPAALEAAPPSAPSSPPPAPPPPKVEIHVSGDGRMGDAGPAAPPPAKGSAKDRMFGDLRKKAQPTNAPDRPPEPAPQPADAPPTPPPAPSPDPEPKEGSPEVITTPEGAPVDKKKANPWTLIKEYKAKLGDLEKQVLEAKKAVVDPKEKETLTSKMSEFEKRNTELEEEIRYVNYSKSKEFSEKYQKPYEEAWKKAMGEMGELTVADPTSGAERPLSPQDILELVNLPLKKAREQANALFGEFADDIMAHRNQIKNLFESQQKALEEARKNGATRESEQKKQFEAQQAEVLSNVKMTWEKATESLMKDDANSQFFKPLEGDEDGNTRLQRGYEMADKAFAINPMDPRLSPAQRQEAVNLHHAIRHRAAAAGRLLYWLQKERDNVKGLQAELAKYRGADPGKGEGANPNAPPTNGSASDQVFGALRKMAH